MESFANSIISPNNLPEIQQEKFVGLNKNYLKILFIRLSIFFIFILGASTALLISKSESISNAVVITILGIVILLCISIAVITYLGFPKKGYLLREKDISYQKGLLIYKQITIPFNRIQHVEVNQGVLSKLYKLSSLKVYTAGGDASDLSIPGLKEDLAQRLKSFLSEKISEHE